MKILKQNIKWLLSLLMVVALSTSCEWIDTDINIDPDRPSDVPMDILLPSIQASMAYNIPGNNSVRTNNIWLQYFDGVDRQSLTEARFIHTPADVNSFWGNVYSEAMMDLQDVMNKSEVEGKVSPHWKGMAQVNMAVCLGALTDLFGDIPYTEALQGAANLNPTYESQEAIYGHIMTLLDDAITNLSVADADNAIDLSGDMIYGGSVSSWLAAAYAVKARYTLNLALINSTAQADALAVLNAGGFTSEADDLQFTFGASDSEAGPIYQFMQQRTDIRMCATFVNMLDLDGDGAYTAGVDDPRLPFYVALNDAGAYAGSVPGSENSDASYPGSYCGAADATVNFMTYMEQKFIEAECLLGTDNTAALAAFQEGIAASIRKVTGAFDNTDAWYTSGPGAITAGALALTDIYEQKYLALYAQNQPYNDWRRTGYPTLPDVANQTQSDPPLRFPYAQDEITYNSNTPNVTNYTAVWWDAN